MNNNSTLPPKGAGKNWNQGFLDGITCAVEILGTTGNEGAAELLMKTTLNQSRV